MILSFILCEMLSPIILRWNYTQHSFDRLNKAVYNIAEVELYVCKTHQFGVKICFTCVMLKLLLFILIFMQCIHANCSWYCPLLKFKTAFLWSLAFSFLRLFFFHCITGKRSCPGEVFGLMEIFMLVTFLLQKYSVVLEEPLQDNLDDLCISLEKLDHVRVRFLPRHSAEAWSFEKKDGNRDYTIMFQVFVWQALTCNEVMGSCSKYMKGNALRNDPLNVAQ